MKKVKILLALMMAITMLGCQKVIQVELETAEPQLVVDAAIEWEQHTSGAVQTIKLSTTTGYYSEQFPTVSGAEIYIANSANTVFEFSEGASPGEYVCTNFEPVIGETYTLNVALNGATYKATETLLGVPEIEDNISQNSEGGMTGDEMEIRFSFLDIGTQENYYITAITSNRVAYPEYILDSDEMFQGKEMTQYYSHEKELRAGDLINIRLSGISKRYYDYFRKILAASGADTGPFPTTPTAVKGNIINQADTGQDALGYFRLSEVSSRDYTIQ